MMNTKTSSFFHRSPTRSRLAKWWGWDVETQRLALLHASDPVCHFDNDLERRIKVFEKARPCK